MDEAARFLTLLALAGGALALAGAACAWFLDEVRRVRRTLAGALGVSPDPLLTVRGRGRGVGFDLAAGRVAVTWDKGGWSLTYRLEELTGVELIVDRLVAARVFRGENRKPLDQLADPQERVRLRLVFDDPGHPDFEIDLWRPEDEGLRGRLDAGEALGEANRWMARMEAMLRRSPPSRPAPMPPPAPDLRPSATPAPTRALRAEPGADDPPWDDDPGPANAVS